MVKSILENIPHPEYLFIKPREFTRELHAAYGSQGALLGILFSGAQSGKLIGRLERDLKTMIFDACPQYREDPCRRHSFQLRRLRRILRPDQQPGLQRG